MLTADDRLAIRELLALYGHIIDERQFSRTHELFTPDARYDVSDFGQGIHHGPGAIAALWTAPGARHPLAHHTVDVIVSEDGDGTVRVLSKGIGLLADGRAGSVTYRDVMAKSAGGWRIAERVAVLRRADRIPVNPETRMTQDNSFDLVGQVALVTGGNSGIGLGLAAGLARAGSAVCIWGTNAGKNAAALEALRPTGADVTAMIVDIREEHAVADGMKALVSRYGRLDSCFANAAVTGKFGNPAFVDSTLEAWRAEMAVNLDGTYLTLRAAARQMIAQGTGGSLVGTSSLAATFGAPRESGYAAAKAGILALMRSLAVELGKYNIRANALLPGWTHSPQFDAWLDRPGVGERVMSRIPLRRWGEPDDWAGIAVYLASRASSFHTGDVFRIDGGYGVF